MCEHMGFQQSCFSSVIAFGIATTWHGLVNAATCHNSGGFVLSCTTSSPLKPFGIRKRFVKVDRMIEEIDARVEGIIITRDSVGSLQQKWHQ